MDERRFTPERNHTSELEKRCIRFLEEYKKWVESLGIDIGRNAEISNNFQEIVRSDTGALKLMSNNISRGYYDQDPEIRNRVESLIADLNRYKELIETYPEFKKKELSGLNRKRSAELHLYLSQVEAELGIKPEK